MTTWIATTSYIVAMYMQMIGGDTIKAVGQIDPESSFITSYLLPNGEKCSGQITHSGNVVCTINDRTIYYFVIKAHAPNRSNLLDHTASTRHFKKDKYSANSGVQGNTNKISHNK